MYKFHRVKHYIFLWLFFWNGKQRAKHVSKHIIFIGFCVFSPSNIPYAINHIPLIILFFRSFSFSLFLFRSLERRPFVQCGRCSCLIPLKSNVFNINRACIEKSCVRFNHESVIWLRYATQKKITEINSSEGPPIKSISDLYARNTNVDVFLLILNWHGIIVNAMNFCKLSFAPWYAMSFCFYLYLMVE